MNGDIIEPNRGTSIDTLRAPMQASGAMVKAEGDRAIAEVQAAMTIAKRFPRDEQIAWNKIKRACQRVGLAEAALYEYTKGGSEVSGPSIRLAEELARDWGNIAFGWKILNQDDDMSEVRAEAWDLETNVPAYIVFTVRHEFKAKGQIKKVIDPREIYELVANQASRRLRACIMRVIPGDVQDMAVAECEKTLKDGGGKPLADRIRDMLTAFSNDHGITKEMIEKRVGKKAEAISETELVQLRRIYVSLRDGMAKVDQFFDPNVGAPPQGGASAGATSAEDLKKPVAPKDSAATPASAGTAQPAQERPAAPAQAAGATKVDAPKTMRVANRQGQILTELSYTPKLGEVLDIGGFPYRVIEITDFVLVKPGELLEKRPEQKAAEAGEATPLELQTVINEVMSAETVDDIKEAGALIDKLPEKDRAAAKAMLNSKEAQIKGGKATARKRSGSLE